MNPMNFGPNWLLNSTNQTTYDQEEMIAMCQNPQRPAEPKKFKMLLNSEPALPLALNPEPEDSEPEPKPGVDVQVTTTSNPPGLWRARCESTTPAPCDTNWRSPRNESDNGREWRSAIGRRGPSAWRQNNNHQNVPSWSTEKSCMGGTFDNGQFQQIDKPNENAQETPHKPARIIKSPEQKQSTENDGPQGLPLSSGRALFDFVDQVHFTNNQKSKADFPNSQQTPTQNPQNQETQKPNPPDNWFYRDPQGIIQGPFTAQVLVDWQQAGYFKEMLMLWRHGDPRIWTVAELGKYGGLVPPVQQMSAHHHANQAYHVHQLSNQGAGFNQMGNQMNYQGTPQQGYSPFYQGSVAAPPNPNLQNQMSHQMFGQPPQQVDPQFIHNQSPFREPIPAHQMVPQAQQMVPQAQQMPQQAQSVPFVLPQQLTPDVCQALIEHLSKTLQSTSMQQPNLPKAANQAEFVPNIITPSLFHSQVPTQQQMPVHSKVETRTIVNHHEVPVSRNDAMMFKTQHKPEVKPGVHTSIQSEGHNVSQEFEQFSLTKGKQSEQEVTNPIHQDPPKPFWPVNPSNKNLYEIQREELQKLREIELMNSLPRELQPKPHELITWQNNGNTYTGQSLDEIQAEEKAYKKKCQIKRKKANALAGKTVMDQPPSFADMLADSKNKASPVQSKEVAPKNAPVPGKVIPAKPVAKKSEIGQNGNIDKIPKKSDVLLDWCTKTLRAINTQIDVPTFVAFLRQVDSPEDVKEYAEVYLGQNKKAWDFTRGFLERRSEEMREKHSRKSSKDDLSSANGSWIKAKR